MFSEMVTKYKFVRCKFVIINFIETVSVPFCIRVTVPADSQPIRSKVASAMNITRKVIDWRDAFGPESAFYMTNMSGIWPTFHSANSNIIGWRDIWTEKLFVQGDFSWRATKLLSRFKTPCWRWTISFNTLSGEGLRIKRSERGAGNAPPP